MARVCAERQVVVLSTTTSTGVVEGQPGDRAYDHFWSKHDWAHVLRTWSERRTRCRGGARHRPAFRGAAGLCCGSGSARRASLDPLRFDSSHTVNESLGAASAEVIRYVSATLDDNGLAQADSEGAEEDSRQGGTEHSQVR